MRTTACFSETRSCKNKFSRVTRDGLVIYGWTTASRGPLLLYCPGGFAIENRSGSLAGPPNTAES
ncbi:MAG: hypothetical protein CMJ81_09570 [Planctomycetaceae bacterium]|nr:hypothetical protein [Planctomycetaceae bacterium]